MRCHEDETVLCVANLSHTLQAVEERDILPAATATLGWRP
ncbi:hypothetical protein [Pantoea ananatis]